ncbi:hypothetical protein F511_41830 [Dorcoceras hygrometricum]|uniref:Uncharacterized protein n=1 Tax=Dorcoceras hygrometricum TaxID=472368 RepID=A0A2Z7AA65_9LAMI|nr:hypothetical protein F511_41830 [Dorcoceras hygrometricum]
MTFLVVRTNQYNQDLGLIHSTNGNHLESPNEGSSIDHQVTIHLHAQNITMFPTNETWYFTSQMLVSSSGGLILILTVQSTRNEFRIHNDISLAGAAGIQTSLPVGRTEFVEALDDLRAFILQRVDDSNSAILSKLHRLERGLRDTLHDQDASTRKLINSVCQDAHTMSDVQKIHLNDVKKTVLAQGVTADIAIGLVMVDENRVVDCISEDIYQQTSLLYMESFLPTDIETVQEMFVFGTVRVTFAINRFGNSKFNATSFAINRYDDVSYSRNIRYHDVTISFSYNGHITCMMTSVTVEEQI